jgi:hypothetical protein
MAWFKVDDNLSTHMKVVCAGNEAMGLWVRAGSWAAQHMTDGFVPTPVLTLFAAPTELADTLVSCGLWKAVDGGYAFNDWLEFQPSREQVLSERNASRERVKRARERQAEQRAQVTQPKAKATRLPADFTVTVEMRDWAVQRFPRVPIDKSTESFIDYWQAKSRDNTKLDWVATWRNWIRRDHEWNYADKQEEEHKVAMERLSHERHQRLAEQQKRAEREAEEAQNYAPPPECEHGRSLMKCRPCIEALAKAS